MRNIPVALQMFTLREESAKDFAGTLKRVADLGFDGVELAGFNGLTAIELKGLLDELGLKTAACHVPLEQMENNLEIVIEDQKILGSKYVVVPYLMPERRSESDYKALTLFLDHAGEICRREGITLCYHNHDFELERLSDGRRVLEAIFDETNPDNVKAELDIYWLTKAGEKPEKWIERYQNRTPMIHLKDMTTDEEQFFAELGTGGVDLEAVLQMGEQADIQWWIVEQDVSKRTPLESIEMSMNYLKTKLPHLIGK